MRQKIPFGIAQIGKAFRNEITPRPTKEVVWSFGKESVWDEKKWFLEKKKRKRLF